MKKNVLFFSPTFYDLPLNENIKKKYDNLSEVANVTVLAFSSQKKIHSESKTTFYLNKKNNSRIFNYLKIFFGIAYQHQVVKFKYLEFKQNFFYLITMIFTHHIILFSLEVFSFTHILISFLKKLFLH